MTQTGKQKPFEILSLAAVIAKVYLTCEPDPAFGTLNPPNLLISTSISHAHFTDEEVEVLAQQTLT